MIRELRAQTSRRRHSFREVTRRIASCVLSLAYELPSVELATIVPVHLLLAAPILDDICMPPYHGPRDHDDFLPLMTIAKHLQPSTVLELGTAHGNTVANICRECPTAKVYTVDVVAEEQTGVFTTYRLAREEIGRVYRAHGFADRVVQILNNTLDLRLSEYLDGPVVDLAIIDACHDTSYVVNDFSKVHGFIRRGGVVLLHDTHPSMSLHLIGSYTACMLLRRRGFDIRHIKGTWWALWSNGPISRSVQAPRTTL